MLRADVRGVRAADHDHRHVTATTTVRRVAQAHDRSGRVPDAPHRVDEARLARLLGLAAQVADVHVERLRRRLEVVAPDALVDLFAREHDAGVEEQELEQVELGLGELELTVAAPRLAARGIEREVADAQHLVVAGHARAAQQRAQARQQLVERERLHEVVVGAGVEPGDAVAHLVAGGEHEHGVRSPRSRSCGTR